jgi:hypothetical protein
MKQQGAFLGAFGTLVVVTHYARRRPFSWRKFLAGAMVFALGGILPYAGTCLWLWRAGVFGRFWFWTVVYSRYLAGQIPFEVGSQLFWQSFLDIAAANWPLEIVALLGALLVGLTKKADNIRWFLFGYFAFSLLSICPGNYFRPHYFILLLPAVAIFSGVAGSWMMALAGRPVANEGSSGSRRGPLPWPAPVLLLMTAGGLVIGQQWDFFFVCAPAEASRQVYDGEPFVESSVIAAYLNRHSTPEQRVAVFGSEPELYFYARRRSASGHIYTYPLLEEHPFALMLQREMCREIEAAKPELFVMVHMRKSLWMAASTIDRSTAAWLTRYVENYYRPVGLVDFVSPRRTDYLWDDQVTQAQPHGSEYIWIFRRKK